MACSLLPSPALRADEPAGPYRERWRPQFHFSPAKNWTNDPNGLVYYDREYHLFYQYNPFGDTWGHMSWGHAVSPDLVHWQHLPVALEEEGGVMIFSGSAVADHHNTSGFGEAGKPALIAIYSGHGHEKQTQNIAYSRDRGRTWTKFAGNPVIDINERNFRDPKVIWHEPSGQWVMVVALAAQRKVSFYGSKDLKTWNHLSDFGPAGEPRARNWECPDLFELPVGAEPGATKWVLEVDTGDGAVAGGSGCQYFVGKFDGKSFLNDNPPETTLWVDYGKDFYAAQTWSDVPASDGRRIILGWMNNWRYAAKIPTSPWRGSMTVPRTLSLKRVREGVRLMQEPVRELQSLRTKHFRAQGTPADANEILGNRETAGETLEILVSFEPSTAAEFGLKLRKGPSHETVVGYDAKRQELFVDRSRSGVVDFHEDFAGRHSALLPLGESGRIQMHVLLDTSSVEVFGNGGRVAITDRIFPHPEDRGLEVYSEGGQARVMSLDLWTLQSAWSQDR